MNDRTHELEKNLIAEKLAKVNTAIEPYSKIIVAAVAVIVVGAIAIGLMRMNESAKRSDATLQMLMNDPEVADKFPGTAAASWSMLKQGNDFLSQGVQSLYTDREEATTLLDNAKTQFKNAIKSSDNEILNSRGQLGLAMIAESLGEIDDAIKHYEKVASLAESEEMVANVEQRIATLKQPETKQFLAWFAEQDFSPADPSLPPTLPGESTLDDLPPLTLPSLRGDDSEDMKKGDETPAKPLEGGLQLPDNAPEGDSPKGDAPKGESAEGEKKDAENETPNADDAADKNTADTSKDAVEKSADDSTDAAEDPAEKTGDGESTENSETSADDADE